jgi:hypothetical protein
MASHYYWIPSNHAALYDQATKTWAYFSAHRDRMGLAATTPQGHWIDDVFHPQFVHFSAVYLDWTNLAQRTFGKTTALRSVEKVFKQAYREFYISFLKSNPQVADTDLLLMDLPKRRTHARNATAPLPDVPPAFSIMLPNPAVIEIHYHDGNSSRKAKPAGVHGMEIRWAILGAAPTDWDELTNSVFSIRTPCRLTFLYNQRGKTLYFALRWEDNRGKKGPWSEIHETIIP